MAGIFLSYRREDSAADAGRLYDRLSQHFGRDHLFMDIDAITPGQDFVTVLDAHLASSGVVLALIGRQWLTVTGATGQQRLAQPDDFVRREIATALASTIPVIPVLVGGAAMPQAAALPDILHPLTRLQAVVLSDTRFHADVDQLLAALETMLFEPEMICIPAGEFLMGSDPQQDT